jgi:hypothetical protein
MTRRKKESKVVPMADTAAYDEDLTIHRLFCSGEFVEIPLRRLQRQYGVNIFPCRALQSTGAPKMLVGVAFQSHGGDDYGINVDLLRFLEKEGGGDAYMVLVSSEDPKNATVDYFDNQITLQELLEKLRNVTPRPGRWGNAKFYWVDQDFGPTKF